MVEPLSVPQIFSLNPATCDIVGAICTAGEPDAMTVNQRNQITPLKDYNGDRIFEEDTDRDGFPDPIIARNSQSVTLKFFAMADDNRMPIRQVTIDWRDGEDNITNNDTPGLYKNRKPFCNAGVLGLCATVNTAGQAGVSPLTCAGEADCPRELLGENPTTPRCLTPNDLASRTDTYSVPRFGNAPRACSPTPFEFEHAYLCSRSTIAAQGTPNSPVQSVSDLPPPIQTRLAASFGLTPADSVCVYRPRVHVRDNWGYCNGTCGGAESVGGVRCYGVNSNQECDYDSRTNLNFGFTPWTEYRGYIIVVPR